MFTLWLLRAQWTKIGEYQTEQEAQEAAEMYRRFLRFEVWITKPPKNAT